MNIVLFDSDASRQSLPLSDHRARHLLEVLRCEPGARFRAGVMDGPSGHGTVLAVEPERVQVALRWDAEPAAPPDVTLIVGLPRPPSAKKIIYQCAAIGCRAIHFVHTHLSDRNYAQSRLWTRGEWRRHVLDGVQQSASTTAPEVTCGAPLQRVVAQVARTGSAVALDHESAWSLRDPEDDGERCTGTAGGAVWSGLVGAGRLGARDLRCPLVLAIGPERGWSAEDREVLARHDFTSCTLGERILRVETACVAALAIVMAQLGQM